MTGREKLIFTENSIEFDTGNRQNLYIMHNAEKSLMHKLADITTANGGNVLEIGFGMGLCSDRIQENKNVTSHTIIEVHPEIYKKALEWASDKTNVNILLGDWVDIIPTLENIKFDGVLHDTCADPNIHKLIDMVEPICNTNCVVAFFLNRTNSGLESVFHKLTQYEYDRLPYNNIPDFRNNSYEIKFKIIK